MGWNEALFYGQPNGGNPGEIIGVDISIIRKYSPATHGSRSSICSFAEKYVWCAVYEIMGYLADRLPLFNDEGEKPDFSLTDDYSEIIHFVNPSFDLTNITDNTVIKEWFLPNNLIPAPTKEGIVSLENLNEWIVNAPEPNVGPWISPSRDSLPFLSEKFKGEWICIHGRTFLTEPQCGGQSLFWINACLI